MSANPKVPSGTKEPFCRPCRDLVVWFDVLPSAKALGYFHQQNNPELRRSRRRLGGGAGQPQQAMAVVHVARIHAGQEMARDLIVPPAQFDQPGAAQQGQVLGGHRRRDAGPAGQFDDHARFAGTHFRQHLAAQRRADGLEQGRFIGMQLGGNGAGGGNRCIHWCF